MHTGDEIRGKRFFVPVLQGLLLTTIFCYAPLVYSAGEIIGFGRGTTGGEGGKVVRVSTFDAFKRAAISEEPTIIEIEGVIETSNQDVKSNKTLIGVKAGATLKGCITLLGESKNIIVKNLNFTSPDHNDGITCFAKNVWIDHCTFFDNKDGALDMTKGADFITISWCKFYYTVRKIHNLANLIADSEGDEGDYNITFHHNWWSYNTNERMPSVRWGNVHVFNNYYNAPDNNYCIRTRINATVLVENNYFEDVKNPWERYVTSGTPGKLKESGNKLVNCVFDAGTDPKVMLIDGKDDVPKPSYPYTLELADDVKAKVMTGAGVPFATPIIGAITLRDNNTTIPQNSMVVDQSNGDIRFTVAHAAVTTISLFDIQGKEHSTIYSAFTHPNQQRNAKLNMSSIRSGTYFVVIKSGDFKKVVRLSYRASSGKWE